jgi:hypothetical protein
VEAGERPVTTAIDRVVTEPGVYDLPDETYHADPVPGGSLSFTGARKLLPPSCPALFRHWLDNGEAAKREFDFGHAAHQLVLGTGPQIVVVDAPAWRTKAAREQRDAAHAAGRVPVLAEEYEQVRGMAAALHRHPIAKALFDPDRGDPEQSLFWVDRPTSVWRRARLDWLPHHGGGRFIVPDYKTAPCAAPSAIEKSVHNFGYHQQGAFYLDGVTALGLADDAAFLLVVQEKTPPYLVNVVRLDDVALRIGRDLNREAIDKYAECVADDHWPGYSDEVEYISVPPWVEKQHMGSPW